MEFSALQVVIEAGKLRNICGNGSEIFRFGNYRCGHQYFAKGTTFCPGGSIALLKIILAVGDINFMKGFYQYQEAIYAPVWFTKNVFPKIQNFVSIRLESCTKYSKPGNSP